MTTLQILIMTYSLTTLATQIHLENGIPYLNSPQSNNDHLTNITLPYRPMSTNRINTINFITKTITVKKTYNLEIHEKYFRDIVSLWSAIFMEQQLLAKGSYALHPKTIDSQNPECRDLRSIIMDELKTVTDMLNANIYVYQKTNKSRFKRKIIKKESPRTKRSFLAKTALSLFGSYMAKKGISHATKGISKQVSSGLIPLGGDLLSYVFGIGKTDDIDLNKKRLNILTTQVENLGNNQQKLYQFANLTHLMIEEMANVIESNNAKITNMFNITEENGRKARRSIVCLQLFSESSYIIENVKNSINDFIMADTLLPKGNKKLFSAIDLNYISRSNTGYTLATGARNLWDYSLFYMNKKGLEWTYTIQVPLTNLPMFTIYNIAPFPVFPQPYAGIALIVHIPTDSSVILSEDDKYFIDKIDREKCTYSGTHGICSGPIGLIDIDFGDCPVSLLLHTPSHIQNKCRFTPYEGLFPRIASSMGQFLISSKDRHDFVKSCTNQRVSHTTTLPGSSRLDLPPGCSLNTSDIKLVNPKGNTSLTDQQIDSEPASLFRFRDPLVLHKFNFLQMSSHTSQLKYKINQLEKEHENDSEFNEHLQNNSLTYLIFSILFIIILFTGILAISLKLYSIIPILIAMRKFLLPTTRRVLKKRTIKPKVAV